jgi:hypothetical protein
MGNSFCPRKKNKNYKSSKSLTKEDLSILIQKHVKKEMILSLRKNVDNNNRSLDLNNRAESKIIDENIYLNKRIQDLETKIILMTDLQNEPKTSNLTLRNVSSDRLKLDSAIQIDKFVKEILSNPETNVSWLPDAVESRLYKNFANVALKGIENLLESSHIIFMGHKLSFVIDPEEIDSSDKEDT